MRKQEDGGEKISDERRKQETLIGSEREEDGGRRKRKKDGGMKERGDERVHCLAAFTSSGPDPTSKPLRYNESSVCTHHTEPGRSLLQ